MNPEQTPQNQTETINQFMGKPMEELKNSRNEAMRKLGDVEDKMQKLSQENPTDITAFSQLNREKTALEQDIAQLVVALNAPAEKEAEEEALAMKREGEARMHK